MSCVLPKLAGGQSADLSQVNNASTVMHVLRTLMSIQDWGRKNLSSVVIRDVLPAVMTINRVHHAMRELKAYVDIFFQDLDS